MIVWLEIKITQVTKNLKYCQDKIEKKIKIDIWNIELKLACN